MKKLLLSLVALFTLQFAFAQSAEEIVQKHITAIGGEANWKKLKTMKMEASMKAQGAEIKLLGSMIHKTAMKMEIEVMGMKGYQILTKTEGWGYMPWGGQTKAEPLTADDVKTSQDQLSILDEFITYKDEGKKLEYVGKDDLEGTECFKMKLTDKNGSATTYWLDAENYYTLKESQKIKANGQEVDSERTYSNYKMTDEGVLLAYSQGGGMGEIEISKFIFNQPIDESIFKPTN